MTTEPAAPPTRTRLAARVGAVPPSGIRRFFDVIATMPDVISLGVGEPDFTTPPQIVEEGVRSLRAGRTHYTSNYGTLELRRALSKHLERLYGLAYDPEGEILITVGASEAVAATMAALVDPGDEVILHEPSYVAYTPAVVFNGGTPVRVATRFEDDFALDPAALEAAITPRTKVVFLGYPCNPTGAVLSEASLLSIAEICARHDLLVVSDEIYDRLVYGGHQHRAFSTLPGARERTVLIGGFSKAYAMTGWRVGWLCAPRELLEGIVKVHQYEIMSAPTTAQDAAVVALTTAEQDVQRMVNEYDRRRRMFVEA
ncbi:MAG: pyridoxal phosphate-dependent aminotransferase, partial [Candidatus Limnocylindrales bacterium]